MIFSLEVFDISCQSDQLIDALFALLLSIESFMKYFRFYWVTRHDGASQKWIEAFPYIEFIKLDSFDLIKTLNLPLVGRIKSNQDIN